MAKARVSVLGLGSMGGALAEGLIAAGHGVTVWNRSPVRSEPFAGRAAIAADAAGAIAASEIVVLCVLDHAGVGEVLGLPGVLPGLALGTWGEALNHCLLVNVTETKTPADIDRFASLLAEVIEEVRATC